MARPVEVTISHDLGLEEARRRIAEGSDKIKERLAGGMMLKFAEEWVAPDTLRFTAKGFGQTVTGDINIFPAHIRVVVTLPDMLASLAETIIGKVEKESRLLLENK